MSLHVLDTDNPVAVEMRLNMHWYTLLTLLPVLAFVASPVAAQEKLVVGLIPKAQKPIAMDGKLTGWDGAFVTPVHVGHPDFANRGGEFLYLWDENNLYIGLRCLDRKPAHVGTNGQIWNGDAVEFYLDTRRGDQLGVAAFGPGTLHMFYTPFTKSDVKPALAGPRSAGVQGVQAARGGGRRRQDGVGLHRRVQAAVEELPGFHTEGGGNHRYRVRAVQQRRRAARRSHLCLFLARRRRQSVRIRAGAAGGADRA